MKIQNSKVKILTFLLFRAKLVSFVLFLPFAFCLLPLSKAHAQGISLAIEPAIFQIDATPPAQIKAPLAIENKADSEVNLRIELRPFIPSDQEDGQIKYISEKEANFENPIILQKVKFFEGNESVNRLSLAPKQKKELLLLIELPKDEPPSDYYFSILFITEEKSKISSNLSSASGGIASNVLLSIGPKGKIEGNIQEFSSPFLVDKGPLSFTLRVKNRNEFFISPLGDIVIKNIFGQSVGRIDLPKTNVLTRSVRNLPAKWEEKFPLGLYKANLTLALSESGPVFRREIFFLALPFNTLIYFLIGFITVGYIALKVKSKI